MVCVLKNIYPDYYRVVIGYRKEEICVNKTKNLTITGIMAALITIMTAYICHVPVGVNGGYIHFGDSLIYLAAAMLPRRYALAAAAIGGGMADLLTAPMWIPATVVIKMLLVLPFTNKETRIITWRNIIAAILAYFISTVGYFVAEYFLFGSWSVLLVSMTQSLIQSGGSTIVFFMLGVAFDKALIKQRFLYP